MRLPSPPASWWFATPVARESVTLVALMAGAVNSGAGRVGTAVVIAYVARRQRANAHRRPSCGSWKRRGYVRRVGTDPSGYALYDVDDVLRHAQRRGMICI